MRDAGVLASLNQAGAADDADNARAPLSLLVVLLTLSDFRSVLNSCSQVKQLQPRFPR
jgi:hypothetical protein